MEEEEDEEEEKETETETYFISQRDIVDKTGGIFGPLGPRPLGTHASSGRPSRLLSGHHASV